MPPSVARMANEKCKGRNVRLRLAAHLRTATMRSTPGPSGAGWDAIEPARRHWVSRPPPSRLALIAVPRQPCHVVNRVDRHRQRGVMRLGRSGHAGCTSPALDPGKIQPVPLMRSRSAVIQSDSETRACSIFARNTGRFIAHHLYENNIFTWHRDFLGKRFGNLPCLCRRATSTYYAARIPAGKDEGSAQLFYLHSGEASRDATNRGEQAIA
jgi:hypothetical protein